VLQPFDISNFMKENQHVPLNPKRQSPESVSTHNRTTIEISNTSVAIATDSYKAERLA
jgi:hypothetical protein